MRIEFEEEQKSNSSGDIDCDDLKCEWNINGMIVLIFTLQCLKR